MLLEISAAQLRACVAAAGIEPWEFELYEGGFAEKAGIACHIHCMDWQMHRDRTFSDLRRPLEIAGWLSADF